MNYELLRSVVDCDEVNIVQIIILYWSGCKAIVYAFDEWHRIGTRIARPIQTISIGIYINSSRSGCVNRYQVASVKISYEQAVRCGYVPFLSHGVYLYALDIQSVEARDGAR